MLLPRSLGIGGYQLGKLHPEVSVFQKANSFSARMGKWDAFHPSYSGAQETPTFSSTLHVQTHTF